MDAIIQKMRGVGRLNILYIANFILAFHLFLVVYVNSTFLTQFVEERFVGTIFMIGSLIAVFVLLMSSGILRKFGNFTLITLFSLLQFLFFLVFAFATSASVILLTFVAYLVTYPVILYNLDIFIESYTEAENTTGSTRGILLTATNTALILAPLVAGFIINNSSFSGLYLLSALLLIPFLVLIFHFRHFSDPPYHKLDIKNTFLCIRKDRDLRGILMSQFLMRFLFSWMVIYMPIYLIQHIGFSWAEFGIMTFIFLLPFALFEYPIGLIADKKLGEKEFLIAGFFIAAAFTMFVSTINNTDIVFWTAVLFMIRAGASLVEITTESYFFKHVDGEDNNSISFFRMLRPLAYVAGPIVGTIALFFIDFQYIWIVLGVIVSLGIYYGSTICDTR